MTNKNKSNKLAILPLLLAITFALLPQHFAHGQPLQEKPVSTASTEADDKEQCIRNLKLLNEAIQAYKADHQETPRWLSELVPQYVSDPNVFICPVCKRTGQTEDSPLADPKITSSYSYLFSPALLDTNQHYTGDFKTHRDLSLALLKNVGAIVPIVRCTHHRVKLELSLEGSVNETTLLLESTLMTKPEKATQASALKPDETNSAAYKPARLAKKNEAPFPKRDPLATTAQIDLSNFYNAALTESWLGGTGDDLSQIPSGLQKFQGVLFDVRGIIQLAGVNASSKRFPVQVKSIPIHQKCTRLHFMQAVSFGTPEDTGNVAGTYIVHLASNQMQVEIPLRYLVDIRNFHMKKADSKSKVSKTTDAWVGSNPACEATGRSVRICSMTWENLSPEIEIESLDFVSALGRPAPFLIAITAE